MHLWFWILSKSVHMGDRPMSFVQGLILAFPAESGDAC